METNWMLITLVLVCVIGLILFLILRNRKDKDDVVDALNSRDELDDDIEQEREKDKE